MGLLAKIIRGPFFHYGIESFWFRLGHFYCQRIEVKETKKPNFRLAATKGIQSLVVRSGVLLLGRCYDTASSVTESIKTCDVYLCDPCDSVDLSYLPNLHGLTNLTFHFEAELYLGQNMAPHAHTGTVFKALKNVLGESYNVFTLFHDRTGIVKSALYSITRIVLLISEIIPQLSGLVISSLHICK